MRIGLDRARSLAATTSMSVRPIGNGAQNVAADAANP